MNVNQRRPAYRAGKGATDDAQCAISFKGPAYTADTLVDRQTAAYDLTETRMGFVALLNDLHKGRDSGRAWAWVIDLSAGLMTLGGGALLCYLAYLIWVP